jgi:LacI family transcriptional regulator
MATIRDVAKAANVSSSTVSLAFSDPDRVNQQTLTRILNAASSLGYRANKLAVGLATGRARIIGIVVPTIRNAFFDEIFQEIERHATSRDYLTVIADSQGNLAQQISILEQMNAMRLAGIVVNTISVGPEILPVLSGLDAPVVCLDQRVEGLAADHVGCDNRLATEILTEHLLQLGHRRIAYLGGNRALYTAREREAGFRGVMQRAGNEIDESLVLDARYDSVIAYEQAMRVLTKSPAPSAILAASNIIGLATLEAIFDLQLRCPEDMSLAMIDSLPWANLITPRITCVMQDARQIGRRVAERLFMRIDGTGGKAFVSETVPLRFVSGASCKRLEA